MGHVVPGAFFGLFALRWTFCVLQRYHAGRRAAGTHGGGNHTPYLSTLTFPCRCLPHLPLEGCLKVTAVAVGMTAEFITAFKNGRFTHLGNAQHMTMFFFFGLNGIVDILLHYRAPLPPAADYLSGTLAFCMEGLLFLYHLHGRTPMDVQVHMLLEYVIAGNIIAAVLEMCYRRNVLPALMRCYFTLLQATWFFQAGFILYPPIGRHWDEHDEGQMMIVTLIFCWHNAAVFVFILGSALATNSMVKALPPAGIYRILHPLTVISSSASSSAATNLSKLDAEQVRRIIEESEEEDV